jgi:V/A-type H+-transporting ATPase subunit D
MATATVSPNRMELLRLKKKQLFAKRGHKLLKDKLEGLLKDFITIVKEYGGVRRTVDAEINELFNQFILASASMPAEVYRSALAFPECTATLTMREKLIMNVRVPQFDFAIQGNTMAYGTDGTTVELDEAMSKLKEVLARMVQLAEAEKTIELVADEIEKTRRRVNALEYVVIPQQAASIRMVASKLEELERGNITRLMKIKQLLAMG